MLIKILVITVALFNPLAFLVAQPVTLEIAENEGALDQGQWWERLGRSLTSALWYSNPNFLPIRDWSISEPEIEARAALISAVNPKELVDLESRVLYSKNSDQVLPIASITKIMTALVVLDRLDLEEIVTISQNSYDAYGNQGGLMANERFSVKDLLYALLMESSNDAAVALAEHYEAKANCDVKPFVCLSDDELSFIYLMNKKAKELGLENTHFTDPSGYDADNVSTVEDISKLVIDSFRWPILWQILKTPTIDLYSVDGHSHHWINTDELLNRMSNIVGGKTGYTTKAKGCLVIVTEQSPQEYLIMVVLGAEQRFLQTEKLIDWTNKAYTW